VVTTLHRWLLAAVVLLLALAVVGGLMVRRTHSDRATSDVQQARYAAVLGAADQEATAFVNLRHDRARSTIAAVADGATGAFGDRYGKSSSRVARVMRKHQSITQGKVIWSGVVDISPDRATVIVATVGTVANTSTSGKPVTRNLRLRFALVRSGDRWLTSGLEFVG
jgi:Mce-associated membrane protein